MNNDLKHVDNNQLKQDILENCNEIFVEEPVLFEEESSKRGFFLSSLSIDETRLSALIICLLMTIIFAGVNYVYTGDISNNLTSIITTLIFAIAGVNITNSVMNKFGNNKNNTMTVSSLENNSSPDNSTPLSGSKKKISLRRIFSL